MKPVLDYQITYLLAYLKSALRGDAVLMDWLQCSPDDLVRGCYRVQPVFEEDGQVRVAVTQIPALAAVIGWSEPDTGRAEAAQKVGVTLWYVFDAPADDIAGDGTPISGPEKAEVWKTCIWDRVCYWLRKETAGDINLMTDGKIDKLEHGRATFFPAGHVFGGFKADLTMTRTLAPMRVEDAKALNLISLDLYNDDDPSPVPAALMVEAEVNTSV